MAGAVILGSVRWCANDMEEPTGSVASPRAPTERRQSPIRHTVWPTASDSISAGEEAVDAFANAAGFGVIRCVLPADTPDDAVLPFEHGVRNGLVVVAAVEDETGVGQVRPARPDQHLRTSDLREWMRLMKASTVPLSMLSWTGAFAGEEGSCASEAPERVRISGRVVDPDGSPAPGAAIRGCGESTDADSSGEFIVEPWRGAPCGLTPTWRGLEGEEVEVRRGEDVSGITLTNGSHLPSEARQASADAKANEAERMARSADPIEIALENPSLSAGARAQLAAWREQDAERSDNAILKQEMAAEFFREREAR